jgi:HAMP domain-containing protein
VVEMVPVLVTVGVGVLLLVALLLVVRRRVVRFTRARAALQERVAQGSAALRALRETRRPRSGSSG